MKTANLSANENEIAYVIINNVSYRRNYAIYLYNNEYHDPVFGIVRKIIQTENNMIYFLYQVCETIGLDSHIQAYVIEISN